MTLTRRELLAIGSAGVVGLLTGRPAAAQRFKSDPRGRRQIYRLSLRNRRGSRAAKRHNAFMRFATKHAADTHRAHPGDRSRIVPLDVSIEEYHRLFVSRHSLVADLRQLQNVTIVGA